MKFKMMLVMFVCVATTGCSEQLRASDGPAGLKSTAFANIAVQLSPPKKFSGRSCASLEDGTSLCWGRYFGSAIDWSSRCSIQQRSVVCENGAAAPALPFQPVSYKDNMRTVCAYGSGPGEILCWDRYGTNVQDPALYRVDSAKITDLVVDRDGGCAAYDFSDHSEARCWSEGKSRLVDSTKIGDDKITSIGKAAPFILCVRVASEVRCAESVNPSVTSRWLGFTDVKQIFGERSDNAMESADLSNSIAGVCALRADNSVWCAGWNGNDVGWRREPNPWDFQGFRGFATTGTALILANTPFMLPDVFGGAWSAYPDDDAFKSREFDSVFASNLLICLTAKADRTCWLSNINKIKKFSLASSTKVVASYGAYCEITNGKVFCSDLNDSDVEVNFNDGPIVDLAMGTVFLCAKGQSHWTCRSSGSARSMVKDAQHWDLPTEAFGATQPNIGEGFFCGLLIGSPKCWSPTQNVVTPTLSNVQKLAVGEASACALSNGSATCWWLSNGALISLPSQWRAPILDISASTTAQVPPYSYRYPHICAVTADGFGCKEPRVQSWYPFR